MILSSLTWVRFEAPHPRILGWEGPNRPVLSTETTGLETSVWRDDESGEHDRAQLSTQNDCTCYASFGDGYITLTLGFLLVASAAVVALRHHDQVLLASAFAALAVLVVAGFNAFADWSALISIDGERTAIAEGEVQFALYAMVGVAAVAAVLSIVAWAIEQAYEGEEGYDYEDELEDDDLQAEVTHG